MTRPLAVLLALGVAACGGARSPAPPAPQTLNEALSQFLDAVKAKDFTRMGNLWGDERGPASSFMKPDDLQRRLWTIQVYLDHTGYRVIEGPLQAQPFNPTFRNVPSPEKLREFRIELQREPCNRVVPITLVRPKSGGWLVYDVRLESVGNPRSGCQPPAPGGTRP